MNFHIIGFISLAVFLICLAIAIVGLTLFILAQAIIELVFWLKERRKKNDICSKNE